MDLSEFELAPEGATLEVLHPKTGVPMKLDDGTAVTITMVGMDSEEWRTNQQGLINRRLAQRTRKPATAEEIEDETLRSLAACIKSWTGMRLAGKDFECTRQNALELMRKLPDLRRQVDAFLADNRNFLKASPTS